MRELFQCQVGLSDHTMGTGVSVAAVTLGATIVEKHFTLSRADGGVDSAFSLEPSEMETLVIETERAWQSLGVVRYGATNAEKKSLIFRRSLYISTDVKKGTVLSSNNVRCVRPGLGLPPKYFDQVMGQKLKCDVTKGTPLTWELLLDKK
jgi:N-acetylneuraminate synthase